MDIRDKVIDIIVKVMNIPDLKEKAATEDNLSEVGINSIKFIEIVVELEKEFDVEFDDDELDFRSFTTITSICDYLESLD
ncbi:acyl carrier protein [Clostridium sp. BNL1100]|uniref:acyl carrier protein n=1 Tax=Clostridium sp. BNL1100 TaxID=755731 RepID=UPI0002DDFAD0|nr:acyl carrier protein [Clostridium sp. BNL1100]